MIGFGFSLTGQRRAASGGGGGAATLPAQANVVTWYKADAGTYQDIGAETTPASANNDPVGTVADQSGNSRNLYQSDADNAKRPLLKTNVQNSKPVLRFDGTDDWLYADATGIASDNTYSVLYCGNMTTNAAGRPLTNNVTAVPWFARNTGNLRSAGGDGATAFGAAAFNDNNFHIFLLIFDGTATGNANRLKRWKDGSQETLSFTNTIAADSVVFDDMIVGGGAPPFYAMDLGELVIWDKVLTAQEITDALSYANSRWAVY